MPQPSPRQSSSSATFDRSVSFYRGLFDSDVAIDGPYAALLLTPGGFQIYLKLTGKRSSQPSHQVGVQYLMWSTDSATRLDRYEQTLGDHGCRTQTYTTGGVRLVLGREPDGIRVVITIGGGAGCDARRAPTATS
jgi:hypothetical protein